MKELAFRLKLLQSLVDVVGDERLYDCRFVIEHKLAFDIIRNEKNLDRRFHKFMGKIMTKTITWQQNHFNIVFFVELFNLPDKMRRAQSSMKDLVSLALG